MMRRTAPGLGRNSHARFDHLRLLLSGTFGRATGRIWGRGGRAVWRGEDMDASSAVVSGVVHKSFIPVRKMLAG